MTIEELNVRFEATMLAHRLILRLLTQAGWPTDEQARVATATVTGWIEQDWSKYNGGPTDSSLEAQEVFDEIHRILSRGPIQDAERRR